MRPEKQEGKAQPRLCSAFLLQLRTNPALKFPSLGRMEVARGNPAGYPQPAPLHPPIGACLGALETPSSPETHKKAGLDSAL